MKYGTGEELTLNDPHVVALIYRVEHGDTVNYDNTAPLYLKNQNVNNCRFDLIMEDKEVQFKFKTHYATESEARAAIEEYIRKWEFDACLERNDPDYFRLEFDESVIEDRNPTPGVHKVNAGTIKWKFDLSSPSVTHSPASYPLPPSDVSLNSHIEAMYQQYMNFRRGHGEKLLGMAYFCLTVVENLAQPPVPHNRPPLGKRRKAAQDYNIEIDVLQEIGRLVSTKGGPIGARKEEGSDRALTLTPDEGRFLEQAIKKMIRRVAEKTHDPNKGLPAISLSDLPQI